MWTDVFFDPAFWITVIAFVGIVVYVYWRQKVRNKVRKS